MPFIKLWPKDDQRWLSLPEIVNRAEAAFEHVDCDREAGRSVIARQLHILESMEAPAASVEKLREDLDEAVQITAWNGECDPDNGIQFVWQPHGELYVQYSHRGRRHATRFRKALDYQWEDGD